MSDAEDLLKKAGGFFSKLGAQVKQTSKQVTGIGRGTVRVELERTKVAPGDSIKGKLVLALPEPVDAKRLVVSLLAKQRSVEIQTRNGTRTSVSNTAVIYHFDLDLGPSKSYESESIPFELPVPTDALDKQAPVGSHPIADAIRTVAAVLQPTVGPVEWSVSAKLEISWGRDLTHDVDIVVSR